MCTARVGLSSHPVLPLARASVCVWRYFDEIGSSCQPLIFRESVVRTIDAHAPFTAPPLPPGPPREFSHCGRRAPRPVHCRKRLAGKLRRDTLWRPGFAALTNREGCPLHNAAGWPRVAGNLMPAAGSWILQSFCSLLRTAITVGASLKLFFIN